MGERQRGRFNGVWVVFYRRCGYDKSCPNPEKTMTILIRSVFL